MYVAYMYTMWQWCSNKQPLAAYKLTDLQCSTTFGRYNMLYTIHYTFTSMYMHNIPQYLYICVNCFQCEYIHMCTCSTCTSTYMYTYTHCNLPTCNSFTIDLIMV